MYLKKSGDHLFGTLCAVKPCRDKKVGRKKTTMGEHFWPHLKKELGPSKVEIWFSATMSEGFTLIELLVVIGIIAIIGAIGTPTLLSQLPDYRLNGATRTVFSTLQFAKMSAASAGREYRVEFLLDTVPQGFQIQKGNTFRGSDSWTTVLNAYDMPPQVWIDHATDYRGTHYTGTSVIAFNPTGTSSSGGVYLSNSSGKHRAVKVSSSTGRIRVASGW
jgi:type IV fimbrial biogenesis protein FimT